MQTGQMSSDANYPSSSGIPLGGQSLSGAFQVTSEYLVSYSISGTVGTGSPSYVLQTLINDAYGSQWVPVLNSTLTTTGQITRRVSGEAVRLAAANGTSPGTGANTPTYTLETFPVKEASPRHYPYN